MPLYDRFTFDDSLIPPHHKKETRNLITVAVHVGWKLHVDSNNACTIISPDEVKKYHFGGSGRSTKSHNRIKRDLFKFGDPALILQLDEVVNGRISPELAAIVDKIANDHDEEQTEQPVPTPNDMPQRKEPAEVSSESEEPHIVSEKPMLAKAGQNRGYESKAAIERRWSDGTTDYKCADCDYSHTDRLAVRSHRTKHGRKPNRIQSFRADVPNAAHYKPRQSRIDALAHALEEAFKDTNRSDFTEMAREALTWVHEQSRQGTNLAAENEELTPEDTLNRIRSLLDDGTFARQRATIEALESRLNDMEERLQDATLRADRAQQTLRALSELASESVLGEAERRAEGA